MTSNLPAASVREPLALRALRVLALLSLALVLTLFLALSILSIPGAAPVADSLTHAAQKTTIATIALIVAFWLIPAALVVTAWRLGLRSWRWIGGGWLAAIPVLVYLAVDEPSRRTIKLEEMAPAFPGAERSYAVLMRYSKQHPSPEALAFEALHLQPFALKIADDSPPTTLASLRENRAGIEALWTTLAPQRQWLDELNAFDRIGDLGTADIGTDIIRFSVWRTLARAAAARAALFALDDRGDDALLTLLPTLEASRKLEPSARTLVRFTIARAVQHTLIDTAGFTLKRTAVSPGLRARLAAALKLGVGGEIGARRLVAVDYACVAGWLDDSDLGSGFKWDGTGGVSSMLFDLFGPFVHNPQRTLNLYGDLIGELQELAARREGGKIDPRAKEFWAREGRPRFKNFGGTSVAIMFTPALSQAVDSYWRIEDKRTALLATLAK
jgi:hypothetical protein